MTWVSRFVLSFFLFSGASLQAEWIKPSHRKYLPKLSEKPLKDSTRILYGENYAQPTSSYEMLLMDHMQESLKRSLANKSKLNHGNFNFSLIPLHHLLNNLCSLISASYLQSGLLSGEAFVGALYQNTGALCGKRGVVFGYEDIREDVFNHRCNLYLGHHNYQVDTLHTQPFCLDPSIDIYFCGFLHTSYVAYRESFFNLNDVFSSVFVIVIDNWGSDLVRQEVFDIFDELKYQILIEDDIPASDILGNGQYVAVIKK